MSVWIISVGSTDLQLPLCIRREDAHGMVDWSCTHRTELPQGGLRANHEGLEKLAGFGKVRYVRLEQLPSYKLKEDADPPKLVLVVDEAARSLTAEYARQDGQTLFRIEPSVQTLDGPEATLPLALPKLDPILDHEPFRKDPPRAVIVLNTRRDSDPHQPEEPVAAGPLVAQRMAQHLGLTWSVKGDPLLEGGLPTAGQAASVDIYCGRERFEAERDQEICRSRLIALCLWVETEFRDAAIWLTDSGGAPPVKELVRRTVQAYFGEGHVTVLTVRKDNSVVEQALAQDPGWVERDRVRAAVARALRERQLVAAFGLASSLTNTPDNAREPWVDLVITTLRPLCTLPGPGSVPLNGFPSGSELVACRCEIALMQNDLKLAILHLGTLFELLHKDLIRAHPVFQYPGLAIEPDGVTIKIGTTDAYTSLAREFSQFLYGKEALLSLDQDEARIRNGVLALPMWFDWLINKPGLDGGQRSAVAGLKGLHEKYTTSGIQKVRNKVAHESISADALEAAGQRLRSSGLVHLDGAYPSLIRHSDWSKILNALHPRTPWLWQWLEGTLASLLDNVRAPKGRISR